MAAELEPVARRLFDEVDNLNFNALRGYITTDAQGVDEISRRWLRGMDELAGYFEQIGPTLSELKSELTDFHEFAWGDAGLVTFWLEQSYVLNGQAHHVSAPTTLVLRREDGNWKVALIHTVPLPAED
jgi:ketosteroid isomerase-like protein